MFEARGEGRIVNEKGPEEVWGHFQKLEQNFQSKTQLKKNSGGAKHMYKTRKINFRRGLGPPCPLLPLPLFEALIYMLKDSVKDAKHNIYKLTKLSTPLNRKRNKNFYHFFKHKPLFLAAATPHTETDGNLGVLCRITSENFFKGKKR